MQNLKLVSSKKGEDAENLERIDFNIWVALIFLCCFGLIMVLSASSYKCSSSEACNYDSMYYFKRQLLFVLIGFAAILMLRKYDYRKLQHFAFAAWIVSIIFIFLLKTPLGISVNGAKRWLGRGSIRFQVAEVVKISVILFLSTLVTKYAYALKKVLLTLVLWAAGGIPAVLLFLISNDLSSAIIVLAITFGISITCTRTIKLHLATLAAGLALATAYVLNIWYHMPTEEELVHASFRVARIAAWLDPERYSSDASYQTLQALYAIGSGGLLGKNLGNSTQKLSAIPEAHTDMIFSIVCEELGLLGATLLISLFLYLLYQLLRLALSTKDLFGSVIVLGIFLHISAQTMINLAVNVNLFPNTGLTLPFISYGGTSVLLLLIEMSIAFSIIQIRVNRTADSDTPNPLRKPTWLQKLGKRLSKYPVFAALLTSAAAAKEYLSSRLTLLDKILIFSEVLSNPQARNALMKSSDKHLVRGSKTAETSRSTKEARSSGSNSSENRTLRTLSTRNSETAARSSAARSLRSSETSGSHSSAARSLRSSETSGSRSSTARSLRGSEATRRSSAARSLRSSEASGSRSLAARSLRSSEASGSRSLAARSLRGSEASGSRSSAARSLRGSETSGSRSSAARSIRSSEATRRSTGMARRSTTSHTRTRTSTTRTRTKN